MKDFDVGTFQTMNRQVSNLDTDRMLTTIIYCIITHPIYIEKKKQLFIGYLDYEKAFDYENRANIILKLIDKGCGSAFTNAIAKMFQSTTYIPIINNKLDDEIISYGVAQVMELHLWIRHLHFSLHSSSFFRPSSSMLPFLESNENLIGQMKVLLQKLEINVCCD